MLKRPFWHLVISSPIVTYKTPLCHQCLWCDDLRVLPYSAYEQGLIKGK